MDSKLKFNSLSDIKSGLKWILEFLDEELDNASKHKDPLEITDEIKDLVAEVEIILNSLDENPKKIKERDIGSIWERMLDLNDQTYSYKKKAEPLVWGLWRLASTKQIKI
jgi:hypothetical protein